MRFEADPASRVTRRRLVAGGLAAAAAAACGRPVRGDQGSEGGRQRPGKDPMETQHQTTAAELDRARAAFVAFVAARHDVDAGKARIVERPDLHTSSFFGFEAIEGEGRQGTYVTGVASATQVFTYALPDAFEQFLKATDFAHSDTVSPVHFALIYGALQAPDTNPYREAAWPILYPQQRDSVPAAHLAEEIALPGAVRQGDAKRVTVWWAFEPGARFELWTFTVRPDDTYTLERRPARYRQ